MMSYYFYRYGDGDRSVIGDDNTNGGSGCSDDGEDWGDDHHKYDNNEN